ncbi:restriction endonuclease subunit S [Pelagibaculum spongiae]|uniref:Restriction endonuclease subunit S n=1 Tax=Pelagibaculum spongiae TaxID=2080658 RepID=A0A2V1GT08_9GAMM|nr:restriction endonuclease subunit S [Pelagibaculum spongiae]PVZ65651.1 restriction endonuclease subunit S [Pelagibaculum spongiae]
MGSDVPVYTVEELIESGILEKPLDGNHGGTHPKGSDFVDSGIPFIMASDLVKGNIDTIGCKFISAEQANSLRKGFSKTGDVLISHKATIGRTALVGAIDTDFVMLTPQVTYYRVKNYSKLNNKYLKYYFDSRTFQDLLNLWAGGGSTRAYLGITGQRKLPIQVPEINVQERIVDILDPLDRKIQLNQQTNQTLENMAQALFKSWFVDFDPVIDNALAAGNAVPPALEARAEQRRAVHAADKADNAAPAPLPQAIRQLFPASFVLDAEMGWIPQGWKSRSIGSVVDLAYGKSLPAKIREPGPYPVYGSGGVSGYHKEAMCDGPGVVVGRKGTVGSVYWVPNNFFPIDTVFYVKPKIELPLYWLYQKLSHMDIAALSADSAVPGVNRNAIFSISWTIPSTGVLEEYWKILDGNVQKKIQIDEQNKTLTKLRDTLLPKLISGELRIPEVPDSVA